MPNVDLQTSSFAMKNDLIDQMLSVRVQHYIKNIRSRLGEKLKLNEMELTELNIFSLLMSSSFDFMLEYTNESMTQKGIMKATQAEFRRFIGTLLLSTTFNLSTDYSWSLMEQISNNKVMTKDRFNEILFNLRGYEVSDRGVRQPSLQWSDQRDKLQRLHTLEEKVFERCRTFFFDTTYGCYVADDELVSSKAMDVEMKTLSSRKAGKEGSTIDVICDSFLQIVLGMRIRTVSDSQLENIQKLIDTLPPIEENHLSELGPLISCDRGYGKRSVLKYFAEKNFKVITITATAGSEHPIVPASDVKSYLERRRRKEAEQAEYDNDSTEETDVLPEFSTMLSENRWNEWTIEDNQDVLLGPEIQVAVDENSGRNKLYAVAYRDIFDKKISQKILRFFISGFPDINDFLSHWCVVPKASKEFQFSSLFAEDIPDEEKSEDHLWVEEHLQKSCIILTASQRTAEWFLLRSFHLTATMAGRLFNSGYQDRTNGEIFEALTKSWFSRSRSTSPMVIGSKNEGAVLKAFSQLNYVREVFEVGLVENSGVPFLAASPDAIATIDSTEDCTDIATVEVKTRVAKEKIAAAQDIARKYNYKRIDCNIGDEVWDECVEKEHSMQVMVQVSVLRVFLSCYIVAQPGTTAGPGRILYVVVGTVTTEYAENFLKCYVARLKDILLPLYECKNVGEVLTNLPDGLDQKTIDIVRSRWPFFNCTRDAAISMNYKGFPPTSLYKTTFQTMYNCLKGGLDANSQQCAAIQPKIKVGFEQKYVVRMILAIVTNSWRAYQVLRSTSELEQLSYTAVKLRLQRKADKLTEFTFQLAMALIRSADDKDAFLDTVKHNSLYITKNQGSPLLDLGFDRSENTLTERISKEQVPLRFRLRFFNTNKNFIELRLTHSGSIVHNIKKIIDNHGKNHCTFCYHRQTTYGCDQCKVLLCKNPRKEGVDNRSCFEIWHSVRDLVGEKEKIERARKTSRPSAIRKPSQTADDDSTELGNNLRAEVRKITVKKRKQESPNKRSKSVTKKRKGQINSALQTPGKVTTATSRNTRSKNVTKTLKSRQINSALQTPRTRSKTRSNNTQDSPRTRSKTRSNNTQDSPPSSLPESPPLPSQSKTYKDGVHIAEVAPPKLTQTMNEEQPHNSQVQSVQQSPALRSLQEQYNSDCSTVTE